MSPSRAADLWAARLFVERAPAVAALLGVAGPRGWLAFAGLYAYFRLWDDRVDVVDRNPERDLQRLKAEARSRLQPSSVEQHALQRALQRRPLHDVVTGMWTALERDAARPRVAMPAAWLEEQRSLVGTAYAQALWCCLGEPGGVPAAAADLAIAATRVHTLRDLHEDLELGYVNVPTEVCACEGLDVRRPAGPALHAWLRREAVEASDQLGSPPTRGGRRTQLVFATMADRYHRMAMQIASEVRVD